MYQPLDGLDWASKLTTPTEALSHTKPGDRIFAGAGCAEPQLLLLHLSTMEVQTLDNEIYHVISLGSAPYVKEQYAHRFRYNSFFITGNIRQAVREGRADYTPLSTRKIPWLFRNKVLPIDVALVQTSMPDEAGFVSLGINVDISKAAVENARLVIAEINPEMPVTHGDSFIPISQIDYMVENRAPLMEWTLPPVTPQIERVARNVATLVEDGSTLQFGFGKVPLTVPKYLAEKKNLGIHSEMITDSVLDLMELGVVNNSEKIIHNRATVAAFCVGTERLYREINNNPNFRFFSSDYVLDPKIIAKNPKMVAINSAIEVDLTGQVVGDSLGHTLYSGIGGASDLHLGAQLAPDGKGIIALPSTAKNGKRSRIVAQLSAGAGVAITRANIEYVVTEFGIAYLHGASLRERVLRMIELAHPKFRQDLFQRALEFGYIYPDQIFYDSSEWLLYPLEFQEFFTLKKGETVRVRPILSSDEDKLRGFFYSLSPEARFSRYFSAIRALPHKEAQKEANLNFKNDFGLAAFLGPISSERIIGTGHFYVLRDQTTAEISLLVHDAFRNQGLARFFLHCLTTVASARGINKFVTELMGDNKSAMALLKDFSTHGPARNPKIEREGGESILTWELDSN